MVATDWICDLRDVVKSYATARAVDGVGFQVRRGEIFALLGPNGAGKSTLVRMMMGIIPPDAGTIHYRINIPNSNGDLMAWPTPDQLGYLPEDRGLYRDLNIARTLSYFGQLRGMARIDADRAAEEWLEKIGLANRRNEKLRALSKGNQQKVQFASAVLHRPAFAVLDEPFSGLDPINQELLIDWLRELRDQGTTILLSAHQMNLVEKLADRVFLMSRGREVLSGTLDQVRRRVQGALTLTLTHDDGEAIDWLEQVQGVVEVERRGNSTRLLLGHDTPLSGLLRLISERLEVRAIKTEQLSLHDLYVQALQTTAPEEAEAALATIAASEGYDSDLED